MNLLLLGASAVGSFVACELLLGKRKQPEFTGGVRRNSRRYTHSVSRTPRKAATHSCVFGKGSTCRFPVGDVYHERKALAYVMAGRCAKGDCEKVVSYLARRARDPEVKAVARKKRKIIISKAYSAKAKRAATRAKRRRKNA